MVPEWIVGITAVGSFVAGFVVQTIVRVRSAANDDGMLRK
jgi:general stress protein CsbA